MKRKFAIINLAFMILVLASMLLQSVHSYSHIAKQLSQKHCYHKYNQTKTEFTHHHNGFEHCVYCDFALSSYLDPNNAVYQSYKTFFFSKSFFFRSQEIIYHFRGSLFALRAPPIFIV